MAELTLWYPHILPSTSRAKKNLQAWQKEWFDLYCDICRCQLIWSIFSISPSTHIFLSLKLHKTSWNWYSISSLNRLELWPWITKCSFSLICLKMSWLPRAISHIFSELWAYAVLQTHLAFDPYFPEFQFQFLQWPDLWRVLYCEGHDHQWQCHSFTSGQQTWKGNVIDSKLTFREGRQLVEDFQYLIKAVTSR